MISYDGVFFSLSAAACPSFFSPLEFVPDFASITTSDRLSRLQPRQETKTNGRWRIRLAFFLLYVCTIAAALLFIEHRSLSSGGCPRNLPPLNFFLKNFTRSSGLTSSRFCVRYRKNRSSSLARKQLSSACVNPVSSRRRKSSPTGNIGYMRLRAGLP